MHPRFLIIKMSALGDIILSLNVARYLKQKVPGCRVEWVVEGGFQELVRSSPYVDEVLPFDTKLLKKSWLKFVSALFLLKKSVFQRPYTAVFDLQGNCKSALMTLLAQGQDKVGWGRKSVAEWPNLLVTRTRIEAKPQLSRGEQYLEFIYDYFRDRSTRDLSAHMLKTTHQELSLDHAAHTIMVCPGSNWNSKQLSEETWIEFLSQIEQRYHPLFVLIGGSLQEQAFAHRLASHVPHAMVLGALPWTLWQSIMLKMNCVISVDSCALHLAGLTGVPTFSIYGPSSPEVYKPSGSQHSAYQGVCPYGETFTKRCRLLRTCKTGACMKKISLDDLMKSFEGFVSNLKLK
jgi:heptosyltransferase I